MRLSIVAGFCVPLLVVGFAGVARAQADALTYDHVHLAAPDPAKAVEWYRKNFGGQPTNEGADRLMFGPIRLIFMKSDNAQPSAGSSVDHIGFSVADLDAKMKEFEAAGVKVVTPMREVAGLFKLAFVEDPWGVKIEVVQDPETLGFHHVHLRAPDPDAVFAWYLDKFGGETTKLKGRLDAVKYGSVWILAQRGEAMPSAGRAIDHLGWRAVNLDTKASELKKKGVVFTREPSPLKLPTGMVHISFVEGPAGTKIELVQR